jgi:hypothetical protein
MRCLSMCVTVLAESMLLAACGAAAPAAPTPPAMVETAPAPLTAAPAPAPPVAAAVAPAVEATPAVAKSGSPWAELDRMGKVKYMREVVVPALAPEFRNWNPREFPKLGCEDCHGPGAKRGQFTMPNPGLEKLPSTDEGFAKLASKRPKVMDFMAKVVTPKMAELLGQPAYDHSTGQGFGCGGCHTFRK